MRRTVSAILIVLLCVPGAQAQRRLARPGDMSGLFLLKPGTHIEVDSLASNSYADLDESCRLLVVDDTTLTCAADDDRSVHLVFPIARVNAVYQIHGKAHVGPIVVLALFGTFIGGVASFCAPAIGIPLLAGLIYLGAVGAEAQQRGLRAILGIPPPPPPPPDNLTLVYSR